MDSVHIRALAIPVLFGVCNRNLLTDASQTVNPFPLVLIRAPDQLRRLPSFRLGAYIAVLWLALLSPLQVSKELRRMSNLLLLAVAAVLLLTVADNTARAVREGGPYSAIPDIQLSNSLDSLGLHPGDRIGTIGDIEIYAARLSHAKIVAEIMPADAPAFWRLSSDKREIVFQKFRSSGARFILAADPGPTIMPDSSWLKIKGQRFYVHTLR